MVSCSQHNDLITTHQICGHVLIMVKDTPSLNISYTASYFIPWFWAGLFRLFMHVHYLWCLKLGVRRKAEPDKCLIGRYF